MIGKIETGMDTAATEKMGHQEHTETRITDLRMTEQAGMETGRGVTRAGMTEPMGMATGTGVTSRGGLTHQIAMCHERKGTIMTHMRTDMVMTTSDMIGTQMCMRPDMTACLTGVSETTAAAEAT